MPVADFAQGVKSPFFSMVNHTSDGARSKLASTASPSKTTQTAAAATTAPAATAASTSGGKSFFDDMLDVVNPLQHLPIVSTIYRAATGDKIGDVEKVAGDTLYGGPIGLVSSLADLAFEKITGKDFGDTMLAMVGIGDSSSNTAVAANPAKPKPTQNEPIVTAALNEAALTTPATGKIVDLATAAPAKLGAPTVADKTPTPAAATPVPQTVVDISPQTDALLQSLQKNGVTGAMQAQALDAYRRTMTMGAQPASVH